MKNKILKISVAMILIMALTMTNFIFIGANIISYATDGIATNHKNIEFEAYFRDDNGKKVATIEKTADEKETSLYILLNVKKEGYFNGVVELKNSNFNINSSESEFISKIENNKIHLKQLNAGTKAEVELKVSPIEQDKFSLLKNSSELILSGEYKDSTEKNIQITSQREVALKLTETNDKTNVENNMKIITNKIAKISGEDKRIIQVSINLGLKNNNYPIKQINSKINVPTVNGKKPEIIKEIKLNSMSSYDVNETEENIEFILKNEIVDNNVLWKKQGNENIVLTYMYNSDVNLENTRLNLIETVILQNDKKIEADKNEIAIPSEEIDNTIEVTVNNHENEIYKGKLNSGIDRQISSETKLTINLANMAEYVLIKENPSKYIIDKQENDVNVIYNRTVIAKDEFAKVFGENGNIQIYNQNQVLIASIDNNTPIDENGNIIIDYTEKNPVALQIKTSKPIAEGTVSFNNLKTIKQTDTKITKEAEEIVTNILYEYNIFNKEESKLNEFTQGQEKQVTSKIQLKDSITEATLEINKDTLSTVVANDVEMKVVLKTNDEKYDLNKNPIINIQLPEQIESININSVKLLYEDELKVKNYFVNGRKIVIELNGEQKIYKEKTVEGTNIIIDATINVNRKAIAKDEKIIMKYRNDIATSYSEGENLGEKITDISIVTPKDVTAINSIKELGVETIGQEENKIIDLERGKNKRNIEVGFEVINNNPEDVEDVNILGTFPTKTEENNIDMKVLGEVNVENAKVYYSENINATKDLQNSENAWKEELTNGENVKKYLIILDNIAAQTSIKGSYEVEIPENLEYNKVAKEGYETSYTNSSTQTNNTIKATDITMQTGVGPKLETTLSATVSGEDIKTDNTVKNGEVIKYKVKVSNIGSEDVKNVKVTAKIPEGAKLVKPAADYEYTGSYYYEEIDTNTYKEQIEQLNVGQTETLEYEIRINKDLKNNSEITNLVETKYLDVVQKSNEIKCKTETGNIRVSIKRVTDRKIDLYESRPVEYFAIVENISNKEQNNVKIRTNLSDNIKVSRVSLISRLDTEQIPDEKPIEYAEEMNIGNLKPGEIKLLDYNMMTKQLADNQTGTIKFSIKAIDSEKEYQSNLWEDFINKFKVNMTMTTNVEDKYVKAGDVIEYSINIKNVSESRTSGLTIVDEIPSQLTITKIEKDNEQIEIPKSNYLVILNDIQANEEMNVKITTLVNHSEARDEAEVITNKSIASVQGKEIATTSEITHIIKANETDKEDNNGGTDGNNDVEDNNIANGKRNISGMAWFDENANGKRDESEKALSGIKVKILNVYTNQLVKDKSGKILETITNDNGIYVLNDIGNGNYIVIFEYNNTQYALTKYKAEGISEIQNSDVTMNEISIDNEKQKIASTDTLKIDNTDISNIDIGLIELKDFDLKLDKTISKMIIQNSAGTVVKQYNDVKTAKAEVDAKQLNGTTVIIEYKIKVSNVGEVAGYARKIADYIPKDLQFSSELNKDWYQSGDILYSSSIGNDKIEPGESKTLLLTLTKTMNEENTGLVNNRAEIAEDYNDLGLIDINSIPGNQDKDENDYSYADAVLSIRTGKAVYLSIGLIIAIIAISGIIAAVIVKRKNKKEV